jgi:stage V sporulation protein G
MVVTEIKIKLVPRSDDKLLAFASVTFDRCFVVRDIKVIQGSRMIFVAMPSRKVTDRCAKCGAKNHLQANYCNQCGIKLGQNRVRPDDRGRAKLHADIAHPINVVCRQHIQDEILKGYQLELERSRHPSYIPPCFDDDAGPDDDPMSLATPIMGMPAVSSTPFHGLPAVTNTPALGTPAVINMPSILPSENSPHPVPTAKDSQAAAATPSASDPAPQPAKAVNDSGGFGVFGS